MVKSLPIVIWSIISFFTVLDTVMLLLQKFRIWKKVKMRKSPNPTKAMPMDIDITARKPITGQSTSSKLFLQSDF